MKYKKKKVRLSSFFVNSKRGLYLWNAINKVLWVRHRERSSSPEISGTLFHLAHQELRRNAMSIKISYKTFKTFIASSFCKDMD